jgi:hypothetical protein
MNLRVIPSEPKQAQLANRNRRRETSAKKNFGEETIVIKVMGTAVRENNAQCHRGEENDTS